MELIILLIPRLQFLSFFDKETKSSSVLEDLLLILIGALCFPANYTNKLNIL
jgi:hypothetical protein